MRQNISSALLLPILFISGSLSPISANSGSAYLTCKTLEEPQIDLNQVYKKYSKDNRKRFLPDMVKENNHSLLLPPPETWHIDFERERISTPERSLIFSDVQINDTKISGTFVNALGWVFLYHLNRVDGKLNYHISLPESSINSWQKKHIGVIPSMWSWSQICSAKKEKVL